VSPTAVSSLWRLTLCSSARRRSVSRFDVRRCSTKPKPTSSDWCPGSSRSAPQAGFSRTRSINARSPFGGGIGTSALLVKTGTPPRRGGAVDLSSDTEPCENLGANVGWLANSGCDPSGRWPSSRSHARNTHDAALPSWGDRAAKGALRHCGPAWKRQSIHRECKRAHRSAARQFTQNVVFAALPRADDNWRTRSCHVRRRRGRAVRRDGEGGRAEKGKPGRSPLSLRLANSGRLDQASTRVSRSSSPSTSDRQRWVCTGRHQARECGRYTQILVTA
jgi:hypothetical protein